MSHSHKNSAIEIEAEGAFCEATPSTTATYRLAIVGPVDVSGLKRPKIDSGRAQQYRNAGSKLIDGAYSGTIKTRFHWFGHGSSTAGAVTVSNHETLLGNILGNVTRSLNTGTTFTGGTAGVPTTTPANGFAAGGIGFAGALADGRGNGQAFVVGAHASNNLTLLTELDVAPSNGDVCRGAVMFYPSETPTSTSITSYRFRLLTANLRYLARGVFPVSYAVGGLNGSEQPWIEVTWNVAYFIELASGDATFPSTVATDSSNPATISGGSLFVAAAGTATRSGAKYTCHQFAVDYQMVVATLRGPGGNFAGQDIIGCRRKNDTAKISFTVAADAVTATPALKSLFMSSTPLHVLWTGSTADGSAVAIYCPAVEPCGEYPVQKVDDEMNRISFEGMCFTGGTVTNDLTASMIRFANG